MSCTHAKAPRLNVTTLLLTDIARLSVRRKGQMPQKQRLGTKHPGTGCERAPNAEAAPRPHLGSSHTQRYALRLRSSKGRILTKSSVRPLDPFSQKLAHLSP